MAVIANNMKPSKAKILVGTDEYTAHINSWRIKANTPIDTVRDIGGTDRHYVGDPACMLEIDLSQDWSATGLATYLLTNHGQTATIVVQDANATWTGVATLIMPTDVGGDNGKAARSKLSLPLAKMPTKSAAV